MNLPLRLPWNLASDRWASLINPALSSDIVQGHLIQNVTLSSGNNVVNHGLGRNLIGWIPVRYHGSYAQLYDTQDTNKTPSLTLQLNASAGVKIDLWCF